MFRMQSLLLLTLASIVTPILTARIPRSSPNCGTVYETKWQTVYHEYEENKCTTKKEQVCHDYSYIQCSKVDKRSCEPTVRTTCGIDYKDMTEKYTESDCSTKCVPHCEFHWETDAEGNKVWVEDGSTCKYSEEETCVDVKKEKTWKKYFSKPEEVPDTRCGLVPVVNCVTVDDQFCTEVDVCDCIVEHKKVPIRVSVKQAKIVCDENEDEYEYNSLSDGNENEENLKFTGQGSSIKFIGDFPSLAPITHPMSGQVYTKGSSTIIVKNFNYTLPGPDAFFWAGSLGSPYPSPDAVPSHPLAFPNPTNQVYTYSTVPVLPPGGGVDYGDDIELELPEGVTVDMISWLSVWCRKFQHNFGHVLFNNPEGNQQEDPVPTKFGGGKEPRMYRSFEQKEVGKIQVTIH